jgi:hypothetical protein
VQLDAAVEEPLGDAMSAAWRQATSKAASKKMRATSKRKA